MLDPRYVLSLLLDQIVVPLTGALEDTMKHSLLSAGCKTVVLSVLEPANKIVYHQTLASATERLVNGEGAIQCAGTRRLVRAAGNPPAPEDFANVPILQLEGVVCLESRGVRFYVTLMADTTLPEERHGDPPANEKDQRALDFLTFMTVSEGKRQLVH